MANTTGIAQLERPSRLAGTREAILDAAERLFAERGFAATSVRDITRASDCSAPSLYHFFGSKEKLLLELFSDRFELYCDALENWLGEARTPVQVCERFVEFVLSNVKEQPGRARFLFAIMFGPQQDVPSEALQDVLMRAARIVQSRLEAAAPEVEERRIVFARTMLHGSVTPAVLLFLTSGVTAFPPELASCIALRVADVLTDEHPVCQWPNVETVEHERDT